MGQYKRCRHGIISIFVLFSLAYPAFPQSWQNIANRRTLSNTTLTARIQGGFLYELVERNGNTRLVDNVPSQLTSTLPVFGSQQLNLNLANVSLTESTPTSLSYTLSWTGGVNWQIHWSLEGEDLILETSAIPGGNAQMFSFLIEGCRIDTHQLVLVDHNGVGKTYNASWTGTFGDPNKLQMPQSAVMPLIALFQGSDSGWIMEGRDLAIGPSVIRGFGTGLDTEIIFSRGYMHQPSSAPELYEIRFRTYSGSWTKAVDPYVDWMENELGFIPLNQKPEAWVDGIRNQAYVTATDFDGLAELSTKVTPSKTYLGRQAEYRFFGFDVGYPDYDPTPQAVAWLQQANSQGFHVGVHVNVGGIDEDNTALIQQFQAGLQQIGTDGSGNPVYDGNSKQWGTTHVYCSAAYAPWRAHLVQAISNVIAAGASVIYLDQTNGLLGKFFVNGVTGIEGVQLLMQEIKTTYPGVVIQTEQFNPMSSRHACFALTTLDLGHPLSGHIFGRFIKVVPESVYYQPTEVEILDQFMKWGHFLPGAHDEPTWLEIANAFSDYDLSPAAAQPPGSNTLSAFTGPGGVVAFFQTSTTTRSLVVHQPGQSPREFGLRHENISSFSGPGAVKDWLIYDESTLYGLHPTTSYFMDPTVTLEPNRFHITSVPGTFLPYRDIWRRIIPQEIGTDDDYFRLYFTGSGTMTAFVPDEYDMYLDGDEIIVDRNTDMATIPTSAPEGDPSELILYKRSEQPISGLWANLQWTRPLHKSISLSEIDSIFPNSFFAQIAGAGLFNGRFPDSTSIRATGEWGMRDTAVWSRAEAVIKINGIEFLRLSPGSGPPYSLYPFDVDLTQFSDQYVFIEFIADGQVFGPDVTDWKEPSFDLTYEVLDPIGNPSSGNGWDSSSSISTRSSSAHGVRPFTQTINGSGLNASTGELHTHLHVNSSMGLTNPSSGPVSRGGTAVGSHWIEYTFDQPYELQAIWIWNYNELNYPHLGIKGATIEISETGTGSPTHWTTVFSGDIPRAAGGGLDETPISIALNTGSTTTRYVVITANLDDNRNHSDGTYDEVGLSEVRFFGEPPEPPSPPPPAPTPRVSVGSPSAGNNWSTASAVSTRASGAHPNRSWLHTIDGSGLDSATGLLHTHENVNLTMSLSSDNPGPVTRGGTKIGSHWVEYTLDQIYLLDEIWIWNYNEAGWPDFGIKGVTIEVSTNGMFSATDWSVVYEGEIPIAAGGGTAPGGRDLTVHLSATPAKWIVITSDYGANKNHSAGTFNDVGLSEIRFLGSLPPPPAPPEVFTLSIARSTTNPNNVILAWSSQTDRVYVLDRAIDLLSGFTQPSSPIPAAPPLNTIPITTSGTGQAIFRIRSIHTP